MNYFNMGNTREDDTPPDPPPPTTMYDTDPTKLGVNVPAPCVNVSTVYPFT